MKVLKFGGTSLGDPQRIQNVSSLINQDSEQKIVVLSAMSQTTNSLLEICDYYEKENPDAAHSYIKKLEKKYYGVIEELLSKKETIARAYETIKEHIKFIRDFSAVPYDITVEKAIVSRGEILSTNLMQLYHEEQNIPSVLLNSFDFMVIDADGEPILPEIEKRLSAILAQHKTNQLFIVQGFICLNPQGGIDNLKRGGSDYTASLIGAATRSSIVEIWTDIDGVHNNDPRVVQNTHPIAMLTFDEAAELAYFGAKVLHPSTVLPAKLKNIPVVLKNTMNPDAPGTYISNEESGTGIKAIAAKDNVFAVKVKSGRMLLAYGFLRKVFEIFEKHKTPIDMITTSEVAVSLTVDNDDYLAQIADELKILGEVHVDKFQTIICVVGNIIAEKQGYAIQVLEALENIPVRMISYGGSENNISILIETRYKEKALNNLHEHLF
ncbi:MAG: aspartate kinase [Bacteroidota bacterium]